MAGSKSVSKPSKSPSGKGNKTSRSKRAGLIFPVGRVHRLMRKGRYAERIANAAPVYVASVLEYLTAEIIELAGKAAMDNKKQRIAPRHIKLAIGNDEELNNLFGHFVIAGGGVLPFINPALIPKSKKASEGGAGEFQESVAATN